jgi:succinyl-CoA synthetase beta subunit
MRCDVIAEYVFLTQILESFGNIFSWHRGIIKATQDLKLSIPLIVRLQGTKEKEAKKW